MRGGAWLLSWTLDGTGMPRPVGLSSEVAQLAPGFLGRMLGARHPASGAGGELVPPGDRAAQPSLVQLQTSGEKEQNPCCRPEPCLWGWFVRRQ